METRIKHALKFSVGDLVMTLRHVIWQNEPGRVIEIREEKVKRNGSVELLTRYLVRADRQFDILATEEELDLL